MAEEATHNSHQPSEEEVSDRGLFDFAKKKEEEDAAIASEFQTKVKVEEECEGEHGKETKHEGLLEKLHRSDSSSSSSSDEEEADESGEKKKKKKDKKKGLKEKIKEDGETCVPIEKLDSEPEEKKGFLEKIKEKLPVGKKAEETSPAAPVACCGEPAGDQVKEKKGFLEKIKEKIPGYQAGHHD